MTVEADDSEVIDAALLHSADARRLDQHAAKLQEVYLRAAALRRKGVETPIHGPRDLGLENLSRRYCQRFVVVTFIDPSVAPRPPPPRTHSAIDSPCSEGGVPASVFQSPK